MGRLSKEMLSYFPVLILLGISPLAAQDDDKNYQGKLIGKFNSYHHQVNGIVYAVNETTFLIKNFIYDGNGKDTFFWAGTTNHPGIQGFLVPDKYGRTNILHRYLNEDFTLDLPDGKKMSEIRWLAVFDLALQATFGDVPIPEGFEAPAPQQLSALSKRAHGVTSDNVIVLDAKTIHLPNFTYDGLGNDTYFWVGNTGTPTTAGYKVPDENGYLDGLRAYNREDIVVELPGEITIFNIKWFSVFNVETKKNFGSVIIPDNLNVPPSLVKEIDIKNTYPNCEQLHRKLQVSWEIFGPQITIELSGQVEDDEYMAFGLSGSETKSTMDGADVAVVYWKDFSSFAFDYNITGRAPCNNILEKHRGVCKDTLVGGIDDNQVHTGYRKDGVSTITYRRSLISADHGDKEFPKEGNTYVVWAIGRMNNKSEPVFHRYYPKKDVKLEFGRKGKINCVSFTHSPPEKIEPWGPFQIFDPKLRSFTARLGPSGGRKGYEGITGKPPIGTSWYINGFITPELYLQRGLTYVFKVEGGNNPHSVEFYHPFIITNEPQGGYETISNPGKDIRILAGVEYTRRGQPKPITAGRLCLWKHITTDRRLDDNFPTFQRFRNSLQLECQKDGDVATLEVTPNSSWPDVVYYHSYTQANMGWKIHVLDTFSRTPPTSKASFGFATDKILITLCCIFISRL